jgi:hypothetical protein
MTGTKIRVILLGLIAVILASGSIGAAYACYETPYYSPHPPGQMDLKIRDQDETWADGVRATWTAGNMAPGDEFAFDGHFVGLCSQFPQKVNKGMVGITCNYISWAALQPDKMAKYMVITRCIYNYTDKNEIWQINCLTGKATKASKKGNTCLPANKDWQIQDVDRDGRVTFSDFKKRPLKNFPSFPNDEACFEMSVRFHQGAGNEFQDDTFTLTMIYALTAG